MRELLERARRALSLYYDIVEPVVEHPRHRESLCGCICELDLCWSAAETLSELAGEVEGRRVCVAGPLASGLDYSGCDTVGAPEGGLLPLVEAGVKPLYVTGDLDVDSKLLPVLLESPRVLLAHVHGDNFSKLEEVLERGGSLRRPGLVVTSQVETCGCSMPLGGYTDGDRAVLVAMLLGAREVVIAGYSFSSAVFVHKTRAVAPEYKAVKLALASEVVREASRIYGYRLRELERGLAVLEKL